MPQESLPGLHERIGKIERENETIKKEHKRDIRELRRDLLVADREILNLKNDQTLDRQRISAMEAQLNKIDDNTTYTRRQMTGILVGAVATGIIGGAITLIYAMIGGGFI